MPNIPDTLIYFIRKLYVMKSFLVNEHFTSDCDIFTHFYFFMHKIFIPSLKNIKNFTESVFFSQELCEDIVLN